MTAKPTKKITAASVGGALAFTVMFILGLFNIVVTPEQASAFVLLGTLAAGYVVREREGDDE